MNTTNNSEGKNKSLETWQLTFLPSFVKSSTNWLSRFIDAVYPYSVRKALYIILALLLLGSAGLTYSSGALLIDSLIKAGRIFILLALVIPAIRLMYYVMKQVYKQVQQMSMFQKYFLVLASLILIALVIIISIL